MSHLATIVPTCVVHLIVIGRLVIPIVVNGIVNLTLYAMGPVVGVDVFFLTSTHGGLYICLAHIDTLLTPPVVISNARLILIKCVNLKSFRHRK